MMDKIKYTQEVIKVASEFRVLNSHTTLDAPDTVYYIRQRFKELRAEGIECEVRYPTYKGERTSFWKICLEKRLLPTRQLRFCCKVLKETGTPNQVALLGVREAESNGRKGRGDFGLLATRKEDAIYKSAQHTKAMIAFDQDGTHTFECEIIKNAKANNNVVSLPIYKLTNTDIWDYVNENNLTVNPLYNKGYLRVGCVGCPMAGKHRNKELADFPQYRENLLKLCDRIVEANKQRGGFRKFETGKDFFDWWLEIDPNQITFDDILGGTENE